MNIVHKLKLDSGVYYYCGNCRSNQLLDEFNKLIKYDLLIKYNDTTFLYTAQPLLNESSLRSIVVDSSPDKDFHLNFKHLLNINPSNCVSKIKSILLFL